MPSSMRNSEEDSILSGGDRPQQYGAIPENSAFARQDFTSNSNNNNYNSTNGNFNGNFNGNAISSPASPQRPSFSRYRHGSMSNQAGISSHPSQMNVPLYQRLLGSHYVSVTNPGNSDSLNVLGSASSLRLPAEDGYGGADGGNDLEIGFNENFPHRTSILSVMRPDKLIGHYEPMAHWIDLTFDDVDSIKDKKVRQYYINQNSLIERFQEIDNLLDAGQIHLNMLSQYDKPTPNSPSESRSQSMDYPKASPMVTDSAVHEEDNVGSTDTTNSKTRFNDHPGNVQIEGAQFLGYNQEEDSKDVVLAILVNFFINFVLLVGKIIVCLLTNSMSVVASLVDSVLDFLSTFIIFIANKLSNTKNWQSEHAYPVGRSRLEPLGVLIFSIIIIISFVQVGQESFKRLVFSTPESRYPVKIGASAGFIMLFTIICKVGCWIWCASSKSSSVQALAQDAMTDIVFNSVSLLMPTLGYFLNIWWFDSLGALLLSVYIIVSWAKTGFGHIDNLTGAVADPLDYKVILYLAYRFAESVKQITALKVYHVGDNLNVEIDVVFAMEEFDLSFRDCHDIAEALQYAIETLPNVERAFVHIDYMEANYKGHLN
ncbi:hypothetical protein CLIB1423_06S02146 [[Candida] railenensis]|uniref:Cation efflux protein transmembrane domain-containing protein n=1 Tax=[Candida] railenensis TaxID=45579 RepID=A0A9P0QNZ8_9ASCO|nr:hypothetical protein CLIB1423_06S02146 [[Candida] railenensis]